MSDKLRVEKVWAHLTSPGDQLSHQIANLVRELVNFKFGKLGTPNLVTMSANMSATMSDSLSTCMSATMCTYMSATVSAIMSATAMSSQRFVRSQRR